MVCLLVLAILPAIPAVVSPLRAQQSSAAKPLPLREAEIIKGLVGGISNQRMAVLVGQYGVDFALTPESEERLRSAGADDELLAAIRKAASATLQEHKRQPQSPAANPRADAIIYDLTTAQDANIGGSNPNGPWEFLGGSAVLRFNTIPQPSGSCFSRYAGLTTDWSVGNVSGNCIPAFAVASGTGPGSPPDFLAGDVLVHSQDNGNGSANGQASITWTAPAGGTITVAGTIWYAQSAQQRSNDFTLTLRGNTLATGTVAYNSPVGNSRANLLHFNGGGMLSVTAGEVLALEIQRSSGQPYGSIDGIDLTVTEITTTQ